MVHVYICCFVGRSLALWRRGPICGSTFFGASRVPVRFGRLTIVVWWGECLRHSRSGRTMAFFVVRVLRLLFGCQSVCIAEVSDVFLSGSICCASRVPPRLGTCHACCSVSRFACAIAAWVVLLFRGALRVPLRHETYYACCLFGRLFVPPAWDSLCHYVFGASRAAPRPGTCYACCLIGGRLRHNRLRRIVASCRRASRAPP